MYSMKINAKDSGFTLLEMMVVLIIVGILMSYAMPAYYEFSIRQRITNESNDLLSDLLYARVTAIKEGQDVTVQSKDTNNWSDGWDIQLDSTSLKLRDKQHINRSLALAGNVASFTFTNLGTAKNIGTIIVSHADTPKTVTLDVALSGMTSSH